VGGYSSLHWPEQKKEKKEGKTRFQRTYAVFFCTIGVSNDF